MAKLGELGKIITGNTPKTSDAQNYESNDICFVKPSDFTDNEITEIHQSEFYISAYAKDKARVLPTDSILVTCIGIIGKVAINKVPCAFNQQINAIVPEKKVCNPRYIAYAIQNLQPKMQSTANAAVVPILNKTQFSNLEVPLLPVGEQKQIACNLNKIDKLIFLRKQQLAKLDELVKARFVEMFTANESNFPMTALNDLCKEIFAGGDKPSEMSQIQTDEFEFPVYANGYENLGLQGFAKNYRVEEKSVTISARGTIGYSFIREGRYTPIVRLITAVPGDKLNVVYLKYSIDMLDIKSSGTSQAQLTVPNFKKMKIMEPPLPLQNEFAAFVERVDQQKQSVQQSLEKLELMKKALMQEYFG